MIIHKAVVLEPELEMEAALWSPAKRREMARVFARWAHQLRVSAAVLDAREKGLFRPRPKIGLPARKAALN